jgi:anti-sigma regulatory factor (Ser/Thr protein kinase)
MEIQERRLIIPAVLKEVATACDFVAEAAREAGLDENAVYHCHLSVEEVCTNVVEHGYRFAGDKNFIEVICLRNRHNFIITIIDDAPPFNPLSLPEPNPHAPLWEREGGGWGVYFVKQYMNEVSYSYEGKRNHFTMSKRL